MKLILLLISFCILSTAGKAQVNPGNPDSLAYQNQRNKINAMLAQRAVKFGQYDASLSKHTGIFGLQTKKDIRRSNDILMDIIKTDNGIFIQTKVLLAFKNNQLNYSTYQQQTVQSKVKETEDVSLGFMKTINKLRAQNDTLTAQLKAADDKRINVRNWALIVIVILFASILILIGKLRRFKP